MVQVLSLLPEAPAAGNRIIPKAPSSATSLRVINHRQPRTNLKPLLAAAQPGSGVSRG